LARKAASSGCSHKCVTRTYPFLTKRTHLSGGFLDHLSNSPKCRSPLVKCCHRGDHSMAKTIHWSLSSAVEHSIAVKQPSKCRVFDPRSDLVKIIFLVLVSLSQTTRWIITARETFTLEHASTGKICWLESLVLTRLHAHVHSSHTPFVLQAASHTTHHRRLNRNLIYDMTEIQFNTGRFESMPLSNGGM
jgi:hypothetical protein